MEKELVKRILEKGNQIDIKDLTTFINDYVKDELGKEPTQIEISSIINLIQQRVFNLRYALLKAADKLDLTTLNVHNEQGIIIKTYAY